MTTIQEQWLANMTPEMAQALLNKYENDPAMAAGAGEITYGAFQQAYQLLNPGEYIQRQKRGHGTEYFYINMN